MLDSLSPLPTLAQPPSSVLPTREPRRLSLPLLMVFNSVLLKPDAELTLQDRASRLARRVLLLPLHKGPCPVFAHSLPPSSLPSPLHILSLVDVLLSLPLPPSLALWSSRVSSPLCCCCFGARLFDSACAHRRAATAAAINLDEGVREREGEGGPRHHTRTRTRAPEPRESTSSSLPPTPLVPLLRVFTVVLLGWTLAVLLRVSVLSFSLSSFSLSLLCVRMPSACDKREEPTRGVVCFERAAPRPGGGRVFSPLSLLFSILRVLFSWCVFTASVTTAIRAVPPSCHRPPPHTVPPIGLSFVGHPCEFALILLCFLFSFLFGVPPRERAHARARR